MILALKKLKVWLLTASLFPGPLCTGSLAQNRPDSPLITSAQTRTQSISNFFAKKEISKPVIDFSTIDNFTKLGDTYVSISNNGQYFSYLIENKPYNKNTLVIQSTSNSWKQEFVDATPGFFSCDSKQYVFQIKDVLYFLETGSTKTKSIEGITYYKQPGKLQGEWIFYQLHNQQNELVALNLITQKEFKIESVVDYLFDTHGNSLLIKTITQTDNRKFINLLHFNLSKAEIISIWSTRDDSVILKDYATDTLGNQIVFTIHNSSKDPFNSSIWYYTIGMTQAIPIANKNDPEIQPTFSIVGGAFFSEDGKHILFSVQQNPYLETALPNNIQVDVWSYKDSMLQSTQIYQIKKHKTYLCMLNIATKKVVFSQHNYETLKALSDNYVVLGKSASSDHFWEKDHEKDSNWLVSLTDGSRKLLSVRAKYTDFSFSPGGKYLIYCDADQQCNYFSYNLYTNKLTNLSSAIPAYQLGRKDEFGNRHQLPHLTNGNGIAAWIEHDSAFLVYDNYDIWQLNLEGNSPPINITNNYGRFHHIKLRLINWNSSEIYRDTDTLLLVAFNAETKYNGFYKKSIGEKGNPRLLFMGPYVFDLLGAGILPGSSNDFNRGMIPIKAKDTQIWILKRMSYKESPNYFMTSDFKTYTPLTNLQPQKEYNWLNAELISFKQLDGTLSQGILYKPDNFNPNKKYPIIFSYYEQFTHRMYQFPIPDYLSAAHIEIPWFVSRGYLVFTPDIYFTRGGKKVKSAYDAVVGAARHLRKFPFINSKRMGISGHSRAGSFTNYIITHTDIFAAAIEGAGISDKISDALQLVGVNDLGQGSRLEYIEEYYFGGVNIWQNTNLWLRQSPILNVNMVKTPLLILHNKEDKAVPWQNGLELFLALQRLKKRVWMLQYDGEEHILEKRDNQKDFTIRATQFFDYYLKGIIQPKWMQEGIPARLKGLESRY